MDQTVRKKMIEISQRPFATAISRIAQIDNEGEEMSKKDVRTPY
jgi:uncharacterized protein YnzC (UPF0291/DUF896 family)